MYSISRLMIRSFTLPRLRHPHTTPSSCPPLHHPIPACQGLLARHHHRRLLSEENLRPRRFRAWESMRSRISKMAGSEPVYCLVDPV